MPFPEREIIKQRSVISLGPAELEGRVWERAAGRPKRFYFYFAAGCPSAESCFAKTIGTLPRTEGTYAKVLHLICPW